MSDYLLISDAAREVQVESHVLRYWEEELRLPIKRNELGHRFYTVEDVERFRQIKSLKERGLQLKAIKMILKEGRLDFLGGLSGKWQPENFAGKDMKAGAMQKAEKKFEADRADDTDSFREMPEGGDDGEMQPRMGIEVIESRDFRGVLRTEPEDRAKKLQWILRQMMQDAIKENNEELCRSIKESVIKELDYQFRMQEERQEEREKVNLQRSEEYYRRMDELLRMRSSKKKLGLLKSEGMERQELSEQQGKVEKADIRKKKKESGKTDQKEESVNAGAAKKIAKKSALEFIFLHKKHV